MVGDVFQRRPEQRAAEQERLDDGRRILRQLEGAGWRKMPWTAGIRGSPGRKTFPGGHGAACFDTALMYPWADHPYRLKHADGRVVYVAEPYGLTEESFEKLAELRRREGWRVSIHADLAMHYPGWTIAIWLTQW